MLATLRLANPQLRMLAAAPMDGQHDFGRALVDVGDDIGDERAQELLAGPHGHGRGAPGHRQVFGQTGEVRHRPGGRIGRPGLGQTGLAGRDAPERRLPVLLQLGGDQSVVGIASGIAPLCQGSFVAGLLEFQLDQMVALIMLGLMHAFGFQRGLDSHGLDRPKDFRRDRRVDAGTAEHQAARQAQHLLRSIAPVGRSARRRPSVDHRQPAPASAAGHEAGEQCSSAPARLGATDLTVGIGGELRLVPFELGPIDVALVVILQQNLPGVKRFVVAITFAQAAVDQRGPLLTLSVNVGAGIERVLEHGDDRAVADRRPFEAGQFFAIGRPGKMDRLGAHRL